MTTITLEQKCSKVFLNLELLSVHENLKKNHSSKQNKLSNEKNLSTKKNTTDIFLGENYNTYGRNPSLISLIYKELKQMSSLQTNSDHLNQQKIRGIHSIKKWTMTKEGP